MELVQESVRDRGVGKGEAAQGREGVVVQGGEGAVGVREGSEGRERVVSKLVEERVVGQGKSGEGRQGLRG